jgi:hypothetical protein
MSYELYGVLSGSVSLITDEKVRPAYVGGDESFLNNVVTPIYNVIYKVPIIIVLFLQFYNSFEVLCK